MANPFGKLGSAFKGGAISEVIAPGTGLVTAATIKAGQFIADNAEKIQNTLNALKPQPNYRAANGTTNRDEQIMTWRLPNGSAVQMYINPQSLEVRESKQINQTRTKGGFLVQYWGANLTQINIRGITGSSGVQGINVLRDIYYAENRAFDLVAATQVNEMLTTLSSQQLNTNNVSSALTDLAGTLRSRNFILRPSLAALATSVLMFYQGVEYKGFFTEFTVTETAEQTGRFEYAMTFMSTETRGKRKNFLAWQKEPLANDAAGALINGIGNALRKSIGLSQQAPEQFSPFNAPYTFGGSSLPASFGLTSTEQQDLKTKLF